MARAETEVEELFPFVRLGPRGRRVAFVGLALLWLAFVAWAGRHEYADVRPALRLPYLLAWAVVLTWGGVALWRQRVLRQELRPISRGLRWTLWVVGVVVFGVGGAATGLPLLCGMWGGALFGEIAARSTPSS